MTTRGEPTGNGSESLEVRKTHVQQMIDQGREEELSEEDYRFAVKNGLLGEGLAET